MTKHTRDGYLAKPRVHPMNVRPGMTVTDLVDAWRETGAFNAGRLVEACDLFCRMIDDDATIALTVAGALTPAGMGGAMSAAVEAGLVDVIVSTGANLYHDLHFALDLAVHQGDFRADDRELRKSGIERIYDVFITSDLLLSTDKFLRKVVRGMPDGAITTAELHWRIGEALWRDAPHPERSLVALAQRAGVPIYTSSPGDSSIGLELAALKLFGSELSFDPDLDVLETCGIVYDAKKNGVVVLGGGSPKNFYLQTQPMLWEVLGHDRSGHDYVVQLTTDAPHWGGLSGATPSEAISWGKVKPHEMRNHVVCYSDSTIALPILVANALGRGKARAHKRLYDRRAEIVQKLREDSMLPD